MIENHLTLFELNCLVSNIISKYLNSEYWVEAEISELRVRSGHCYMELVQKQEESNTPIAKASAKCWKNNWPRIQEKFIAITAKEPIAGMKMLLKVKAQFHESYGFSWIVSDIDPTFTLGDMLKKRMEIINKLKQEGVFDLNKELKFPLFSQRIAVISSAGAAGYGDFCNQLDNNSYGFKFSSTLFPAIMQGEKVEESIIEALDTINNMRDMFDCVVIIRGGGATSDLSGFDTLALAECVANFPLPIITGIGHERDESILDMISHTRVKTPTAAATFLIDNLSKVLERIERAKEKIVNLVTLQMKAEHLKLDLLQEKIPTLFLVVKTQNLSKIDSLASRLTSLMRAEIDTSKHKIDLLQEKIPISINNKIKDEKHKLEILSSRALALDPIKILKRGYSITLHEGKIVKDAKTLKKGDEILTRLENGSFESIVKE